MQFNTRLFLTATFSLASVTQACVYFIAYTAITEDNTLLYANLNDGGNICSFIVGPQLECQKPNLFSAYVDIPNQKVDYKAPGLVPPSFPIQFRGDLSSLEYNVWTATEWCT